MSTYYEIFAEVQHKGKWYSLNPIVKKADGTYKIKEVFWAQSGFREMYYDLEDKATERGLPDNLSPEVRALFHANLDDIVSDWDGKQTYREEYNRTVLIVPYNKLKPHIVRDRPYKHMGYVYRELISENISRNGRERKRTKKQSYDQLCLSKTSANNS